MSRKIFFRVTLLFAVVFFYIIIECESKKYLVKSKSKTFLVNTETGSNTKTKKRNLIYQKRAGYGQKEYYPTNYNDYSDLQTKQRNLNSHERKHRGTLEKRKNYPKNRSVNNDFIEFGNDYNDIHHRNRNVSGQKRKHGKGFGRNKHSKSKSYSKNRNKKHRKSYGRKKHNPKNGSINHDFNEFGFDYNNGWISK